MAIRLWWGSFKQLLLSLYAQIDVAVLVAFILGFLVRVYQFGEVPPGLNQDEASTAYDAFSLLQYGVDRHGFHNPIMLVSWGSGMYALASYLEMPFIWFFGLSEYSARLVFLLLGLSGIPMAFFFMKECVDARTGRIAALLFAISPWHIMVSRWALDSNVLPTIFLAAMCAYVAARKRHGFLPLAYGLFAICLYAYGTAYVVVPITVFLLTVHAAWTALLPKKIIATSVAVFLVVSIPIGIFLFINTFDFPSIKTPIMSIPRLTGVPRFQSASNTDVLSWDFLHSAWENVGNAIMLLWKQSDGLSWNAIPGFGIMFWFSLPLAIIGLFYVVKSSWSRTFNQYFPLIAWLVAVATLSVFVSWNINRANVAMPLFIFFVAVAVNVLSKHVLPKIAIFLIFSLTFCLFATAYFGEYKHNSRDDFFASFGDAIRYADERSGGDPLCITDSVNMSYIFTLFYLKGDPNRFRETVVLENPGDEFQYVSSYDRYTFGIERCIGSTNIMIIRNDERKKYDQGEFSITSFENFSVMIRR